MGPNRPGFGLFESGFLSDRVLSGLHLKTRFVSGHVRFFVCENRNRPPPVRYKLFFTVSLFLSQKSRQATVRRSSSRRSVHDRRISLFEHKGSRLRIHREVFGILLRLIG
ncbi:hypothetical protein QYF36_001613 [Acer negundo]|nr:hypothetical protein QYF36_001613 [Acer negundo]